MGDDKLAKAQRFAATELRSGVFLSQGDGTYHFEPLPRVAQIAPLQGIVAGDFDGDGHADIYAVQNSFAPITAVGRFDGGLSQLLRGDGRGHFTAVPVAESNLIVPGDAKALVVLDLDHDGWPDFLVSRNNDQTLAFPKQRRRRPQVRAHQSAGPGGKPDRSGRENFRRVGGQINSRQRSLRRVRLLQPVYRGLFLWLFRRECAA